MTRIDRLASELAEDSVQASEGFAFSTSSPLIRIYKGPYPVVDHIMMPLYQPTADLFISTSFSFEGDGNEGPAKFEPGSSDQYCGVLR